MTLCGTRCHHVLCRTSDDSNQFTNLQVRPKLCPFTIYAYAYSHPSPPSSYVEDPIWQGKFTAIWCSCLGVAIILSFPSLVHALAQGRALAGLFGVSEGSGKIWYSAVISEEKTSPSPSPSLSGRRKIAIYWDSLVSIRQWSVPYLEFNAGQGTYSTIRFPRLVD